MISVLGTFRRSLRRTPTRSVARALGGLLGQPIGRDVPRGSNRALSRSLRRSIPVALALAAPVALAYRFALVYRAKVGVPERRLPQITPDDLGLPYESLSIRSGEVDLSAWFVPAATEGRAPAIVVIHGWESNRAQMLPNAQFLRAIGLHTLLVEIRGHGANAPERLPVSGAEFAKDTRAAVDALFQRGDVSSIGLLGHSMGGVGAILAAAADPRVRSLVVIAAPADPKRLIRHTFRVAKLPIPGPLALPLAWLTIRVYLKPRGHRLQSVDARRALPRYRGPVLIVHGEHDPIVPLRDLELLARTAQAARRRGAARQRGGTSQDGSVRVETVVLPAGEHSWQYEDPAYRRTVAEFLTRTLPGPMDPRAAAEIAAGMPLTRPAGSESQFGVLASIESPSRYLIRALLLPGRARRAVPIPPAATAAPSQPPPSVPHRNGRA